MLICIVLCGCENGLFSMQLNFYRYEKSYMHRDVVTHVAVSVADFFITGSLDGAFLSSYSSLFVFACLAFGPEFLLRVLSVCFSS